MIANSEQAMETLRHKRTGELLPTKNIARNTKLVYLDDEFIGLQFHQTIIATYVPSGVVIDTRDRHHPNGWFTLTTWDRINEFTPASNFTNAGLRHLRDRTTGESMLYDHGAFVASDGHIPERPLDEVIEQSVVSVVTNFPRRCDRLARSIVNRWVEWGEADECCKSRYSATNSGEWREHFVSHMLANEHVIPPSLDALAQSLRTDQVWGEQLRAELVKDLRAQLREFMDIAVHKAAPDFPYPQLPRRRT